MTRCGHRWTSGLTGLLRRFAGDERGTTMTEFIITLPVMIVIFAGLVELGEVNRRSVKNWAQAHRDVFGQAQDIQQVSFDEMLDNITSGDEYLPAVAGWSASEQVVSNPPLQKSRITRGLVLGAETTTYSVGTDTMASAGHLGEAAGRTIPTRPWADLIGVEDAVSSSSGQFVGQRRTRSVLTQSLVVDGFRPSRMRSGSGCDSVFSQATSAINGALDASGVRPALAAGIRYGTVLGTSPTETFAIGGRTYSMSAYFSMAVPPHVYPEDESWMRPASTIALTRFAMTDCANMPYQRLLGVFSHDPKGNMTASEMRELRLPSNWNDWSLEVPGLHEAGLSWPLDYGADSE